MKSLRIIDDGRWASTITQSDNGQIYIFARGKIDWREANSLVSYGYPVDTKDNSFLDYVSKRAVENNYEVELVNITN